jgi:hypothetical protein
MNERRSQRMSAVEIQEMLDRDLRKTGSLLRRRECRRAHKGLIHANWEMGLLDGRLSEGSSPAETSSRVSGLKRRLSQAERRFDHVCKIG